MGRTFAYCRVSTTEQDVKNQMHQIRERGYKVAANREIKDIGVSGSIPAMQRPNFLKLIDRLESGDELVVLKLDRLGRDNIDVQQTIQLLTDMGVTIHCLDLPIPNLSSNEGKLMLQMFAAFAEFERNRIRERTIESIERRKAEGLSVGRPEATDTTKAVQKCKAEGLSQSKTARALGISIPTVKRHWNKQP
ncbi:recombinase family protein [Salmonella enterica]|nr:recombinase family protein [Salmonella enterica]EKN6871990.1 recombinase family protein [Salmonella enterica]